ncbi:MAG: LysM peptidoglycan-binding domain-containing protein, partial [Fimbriimonadaceae bacterium]|nr:LysM peptidoglycan-binding domain-containing protein [Fimbriimonadaceae bacterium]
MLISSAVLATFLLNDPGFRPQSVHVLASEETLLSLAAEYGVSPDRVVWANPQLASRVPSVGERLIIPARVLQVQPAPMVLAQARSTRDYRVVSGDTDVSLAAKFGVSSAEIRRLNPGVDWTRLKIGQVLKVPGTGSSRPSASTYKVVAGDTGEKIAQKTGVSLARLKQLNPGLDFTRLQIGQSLRLSAPAPAVRPAAASTGRGQVKFIRSEVNLRAGGSTARPVVAQVKSGAVATVLDQVQNWFKVRLSDGRVGWVRNDMVQRVGASPTRTAARPPASTPAPAARPATVSAPSGLAVGSRIVLKSDSVNMRSGPGTENRSLRTLPRGTTGTVTVVSGQWV